MLKLFSQSNRKIMKLAHLLMNNLSRTLCYWKNILWADTYPHAIVETEVDNVK